MFEFSRNRMFKQLQIINYAIAKASLYMHIHKKPHIKVGIQSLAADTAAILSYNLPDTI